MRTLFGFACFAFSCGCILSAGAQDQAQAQTQYDPSPFLSSMVALRSVALTCEPFVANSPAQRTAVIGEFFETLNQELPQLADATTQSSLNRFVPSQAAVLCRDKMNVAMSSFRTQAQIYSQSKPEEWPDPPDIAAAPWCSSENCLEF